MILSLAECELKDKETLNKSEVYDLVQDFSEAFKSHCGALTCRELTGTDLKTEEGQAYFSENEIRSKVCEPCVQQAAELLIKYLNV